MQPRYVSILPVPPGIHAIIRLGDAEFELLPAICLGLREAGTLHLLVLERWGEIADPREDGNFVGWSYQGETLDSAAVIEFLRADARLEAEERHLTEMQKVWQREGQTPGLN